MYGVRFKSRGYARSVRVLYFDVVCHIVVMPETLTIKKIS